jgi:hypothetical protein
VCPWRGRSAHTQLHRSVKMGRGTAEGTCTHARSGETVSGQLRAQAEDEGGRKGGWAWEGPSEGGW